VGGEGAHVREGRDPERRGEAEPPGHPQAARGALLPCTRLGGVCSGGDQRGQQRACAQLRGPGGKGVAVPVLVLEQQPELRDDQRVEPLRQGEAPRRRGHRGVRAWSRRPRPLLHRLPPTSSGRRVPAPVAVAAPAAPVRAHLPVAGAGLRRVRARSGTQQPARVVPPAPDARRRGADVGARARCGLRGGGDEVEAGPAVRGEPGQSAGDGGRRQSHRHGIDASAAALAVFINFLVNSGQGYVLFGSWTVKQETSQKRKGTNQDQRGGAH
jgi:hypothetical protein